MATDSLAVLGFCDIPMQRHWGEEPAEFRSPSIDDVPLRDVLAPLHATRHREELDIACPLTSLFEPPEQVAWLTSLTGGPSLTVLEPGRTAIAYCPQCFSDTDGWVLACRIRTTDTTVTWDRFGIDNDSDNFGRYGKPGRTTAPPSGWFEECFSGEFAIVFDRAQYESAVATEVSRLTSSTP
ncbi:hypothetical protein [Microcella frigidaquae]|uniref:Ig-like domain-containing protein n=1 Tax=Microcella frigidaquae TaxID=424758 RepID=A0A840XIN9_9MICO|nr:hypothetical protein [Microcella frigidaquae]MBB5616558.1 hypothetical protein [Microcella frigidaquae]NHN44832.1 hypothetical protein [Microcella frigidaquae]